MEKRHNLEEREKAREGVEDIRFSNKINLPPPPNPSHLTQYWWRGVGGLGHSKLNLGKVGSIFFGKGVSNMPAKVKHLLATFNWIFDSDVEQIITFDPFYRYFDIISHLLFCPQVTRIRRKFGHP